MAQLCKQQYQSLLRNLFPGFHELIVQIYSNSSKRLLELKRNSYTRNYRRDVRSKCLVIIRGDVYVLVLYVTTDDDGEHVKKGPRLDQSLEETETWFW